MWFSRVWFILLTLLTSVLISGALNTSSHKERAEYSAREVELLTERHTLQLTVESSDLASQPEVDFPAFEYGANAKSVQRIHVSRPLCGYSSFGMRICYAVRDL